MGIDANIYAQFQPKQLTMADMIRQQQAIQMGQQAIQTGDMDYQKAQLGFQNQQKLSDLYRNGASASDPNIIQATDAADPLHAGDRALARQRGVEQGALAQKNMANADQLFAKTYLEKNELERKNMQDGIQSTGVAANAALKIQDPAARTQFWMTEAVPKIAQQFQPQPWDSDSTKAQKQQALAAFQQHTQEFPTMPPDQQAQFLQNLYNMALSHADIMAQAKQGNFTGLHAVLGPDGKPAMAQVNGEGDTRLVPGLKPIPTKASAGAGGLGGIPLSAGASTDDALSQIPAQYRNLVKSLGEYRASPNDTLPRGKERLAIMSMVQQVYPNWNANDASQAHDFLKDLAKSSPTSAGGQVQAINNIGEHLSIMLDANKNLGGFNGLASPLNYLKVGAESLTGDKDLARWNSGISFFTSEGQKLVKGGLATEGEVNEALSHLNAAKSPEARSAALGTAAEFFYGKIKGLEDRMAKLTQNQGSPNGLLSLKAQQNFQRAFKEAGIDQPQMLPPSGSAYTNTGVNNNRRVSQPPTNTKGAASVDDLLKALGH